MGPPAKIQILGFKTVIWPELDAQAVSEALDVNFRHIFCTLFLVRWVPWLKSFNLIDFILLGLVSGCFGEGSGGSQASNPSI